HGCSRRCGQQHFAGCCACRDTRPGSRTLPHAHRIASYCLACRLFWQAIPEGQLPLEWKSSAQLPISTPQLSYWICPHTPQRLCDRRDARDRRCCACRDSRSIIVSKNERIRQYCFTCYTYWVGVGPENCPPAWQLHQVPCQHGRSSCDRRVGYAPSC